MMTAIFVFIKCELGHANDVAASLIGTVIKDPVQDAVVWREYLETVVKERSDWKDLYRACREIE